MLRIACIVGARPNFIKIAPILKEMRLYSGCIKSVLIHTGQHYDAQLSDVFFRDLEIATPDHHLGVGRGTPAFQTAAIMERFDELCASQKFDRLLVVGDVTSTLACAITAAKRRIPVDHVEAGLRSFDRSMPEEINRLVTDALADLCFVSEPAGIENLLREGHAQASTMFVGNVMIDSLFAQLSNACVREKWRDFNVQRKSYALVTLHRPSNVDSPERLRDLMGALQKVSGRLPVIFPVHPRTRKNLEGSVEGGPLILCEPMGYIEFLSLMEGARFVVTDSGGIQEETTALRIPCLTLRPNTERPVTVEVGSNTLVGEQLQKLDELTLAILSGSYKEGRIPELWDGKASERIVATLAQLAG